MTQYIPAPPPPPPPLSPDGRYVWTGYAWLPLKEPYQPGRPLEVLTPKSPGLHVLFSWLLPGLGTMLAGRKLRGAIILVGVYGVGLLTMGFFIATSIGSFSECFRVSPGVSNCVRGSFPSVAPGVAALFDIGWLVATGVWIFGLIDGYRSAKAWNREHGFPG